MINRSQTLRLSNNLCSRYFLFKRIFHASEAFLLKVRKKILTQTLQRRTKLNIGLGLS